MNLTYQADRPAGWDLDGQPCLPFLVGAARIDDWYTRCMLARGITRVRAIQRAYGRLRESLSAFAPAVLGHMAEPKLADPSVGIWCSGEPDMWRLRQDGGWASPDLEAVRNDALAHLAHYGASTAAWLLTEPFWDMLRMGLGPEESVRRARGWIDTVRAVRPDLPVILTEATPEPGKTPGWTRAAVIGCLGAIRPYVDIIAANVYSSRATWPADWRPWWWADVDGPLGIGETSWLPYEWSAATADERRLEAAGWHLPGPKERQYPGCIDHVDRCVRFGRLNGTLAADPKTRLLAYYGGTSHVGAPWGICCHGFGREDRDRWLSVPPIRAAAAEARSYWWAP